MTAACATEPPPIIIVDTPQHYVWIIFDPEANPEHSHPLTMTSQQMAAVLRGVLVASRNQFTGIVEGEQALPAFTPGEVSLLSPYLVDALRKASPKDMAAFYLAGHDARLGKVITSGGLFVRDDRMFLILANHRSSPSSKLYETTYEIDSRDNPLLPVARYQYAVSFNPPQVRIPNATLRGKIGYERYLDESKLIVIDLKTLLSKPTPN
jgi:hypothetical protein